MKNMKINAALAIFVFGVPLLPVFAQDAATHHPDAQPAAQAATPQMPMPNMMEECQKRHQVMQATLSGLDKKVTETKKTNDPVQLHAALDKVQLGGVTFDRVPSVATEGLSSRAPANVGIQLLSRFHLTVDYAGDRVWMTPYADAATRPFRKNRSGLALVPEGEGLVVDFVSKGSPADRAGWKKGDRVTAIDGAPIPADYAVTEASLWVTGPAGRTVTLTDGEGRKTKLTLADYY